MERSRPLRGRHVAADHDEHPDGADGQQDATQNGAHASNSCSSLGSFCEARLTGTNGDFTTFSCADGSCPEVEGPSILLGDSQGAPSTDYNPAGVAEAFGTTASGTGSVDVLHVFVDPASEASTLVAGVYTDNEGHPGALLGTGTLTANTPGMPRCGAGAGTAARASGALADAAVLPDSGFISVEHDRVTIIAESVGADGQS